MDPIRATILTIGTEISSGQILNRNAAWLANELIDLKINPVWHLTVPDERNEVLAALSIAASQSQLIIVTGGLGPTSDDLTRNFVCEWSDDTLVFRQASWDRIVHRFSQLGLAQPAESNRQQCFFPSRALVLENPIGTADAFGFERDSIRIWCLPGPPEEIKAIWKSSLHAQLSKLGHGRDAFKLFRWQLLGKSESSLGELVEACIAGSSLISGYRPHIPYVEIKIWCRESELTKNQYLLDKLDTLLSPWLVSKDDEDSIDVLLLKMKKFRKVHFIDCATHGAFAERLGQAWQSRRLSHETEISIDQHFGSQATETLFQTARPQADELLVGILPLTAEGVWEVLWQSQNVKTQKQLKLPYRRDIQRLDRDRRFITEMTLAHIAKRTDQELLA